MPSSIARLLAALLAVVVLTSACSSASSAASSTNDDPVETADGSVDADSGSDSTTAPQADDQSTTTTTPLPPESTTTFVPDLEGPFSTNGGAQFDPAAADVIISESDDRSGPVAQMSFPTDWTRRTIDDWEEILAGLGGSDPRDGIPPIDDPIFETPALASQWLSDNEPGAMVIVDGDARFYALSILTRHEIVNDAFGDVPVAVTYCPLCNTAIAFDRRVNGEVLRFGVSGLLRNSDLVMWDDQTVSLWQQVTGEGIVGEYAGANLEPVSTAIVSFGQFREAHPDGKSLAAESAFGRTTYGSNPYVGYSTSARPFLFDGEIDDRELALSRVVGVTAGDAARAYAFDDVRAAGAINDVVGNQPVVILSGGRTTDALDGPIIAGSANIGTALALDPVVDGQTLTFSANGDDTFTDDQTGSTWTVLGQATAGELAGTQLDTVVHRNEFWFAWQAFFGPDTLATP